jgi:preprotein translocase subunit SecY
VSDLYAKIRFTILMLLVYRIGSFIPIAGLDSSVLSQISDANSSGVLGMLNILSGGSLGRMSIFALAIMPYITASIAVQMLSITYKPLQDLKNDVSGRIKIKQLSRYLTLLLAAGQGYAIVNGLINLNTAGDLVVIPVILFKSLGVLTLVVGTLFLMWLGEQISELGIGNGASLIIFTGIVSGLPSAFIGSFQLIRKGAMNPMVGILIIFIVIFLISIVVFCETAFRKVVVHNSGRYHSPMRGNQSHIPMKLNISGVIPPIFASTILLFPLTLINLMGGEGSSLTNWVMYNFSHGKMLFIVSYGILIVVFSFLYTAIVFDTKDVSKKLQSSGSFIKGKRPGEPTAKYFDFVLTRLTVIGSGYLCLVCIVPEFLMSRFAISFAMSGTSLLIIVNVITDTIERINSHLTLEKYKEMKI